VDAAIVAKISPEGLTVVAYPGDNKILLAMSPPLVKKKGNAETAAKKHRSN
jgi:hypothetical protein